MEICSYLSSHLMAICSYLSSHLMEICSYLLSHLMAIYSYLSSHLMALCHLLGPLLVPDALHPLCHGPHLLGEGCGGASQLSCAVHYRGGRFASGGPLDQGALCPLLLPGSRLETVRLGGGVPVTVVLSLVIL